MKIKKTIELELEKNKGQIICKENETANLILGTTAAMSNQHLYGIIKKKQRIHIPVDTIKKRICELENRKNKIEASLEIMKQVI